MQINKKTLDAVCALPDDALLTAIRTVAAANGIDLSSVSLDANALAAFRKAVAGATDADMAKLKEVLGGLGGRG